MFFVLLTVRGDQRTEQYSRGETSYHRISYTYIHIYMINVQIHCLVIFFHLLYGCLQLKLRTSFAQNFRNQLDQLIFILLKLLVLEAYQHHLMWSWALYAMYL